MIPVWRGPNTWPPPYRDAALAAILIGAGTFNLYDGLIQHALLHLHLVSEHVCLIPNKRAELARDLPARHPL